MTHPTFSNLRIDIDRLLGRLMALGQDGALEGGGVCRLALSDTDKLGRDRVVGWMKELGLTVTVDKVGNLKGVLPGREDLPPVMIGSHIDTVATGGLYDGNLGVLAGLEVVSVLKDSGYVPLRPIVVAAFTNEEGSRFAPDMMGSAVDRGSLPLDEALAIKDAEGFVVGEELARIGYAGETDPGHIDPYCFFEIHVEQGPVLEEEGDLIGAVTGVQGISWTEYVIEGESNHAGTTPMRLRHDAGFAAAAVAVAARKVAGAIGDSQVATVGVNELDPNLVNVIARKARMTVDLRNIDEVKLQQAESMLAAEIEAICKAEGVSYIARKLARFEPVMFDSSMVDLIAGTAKEQGYAVRRMPSGAGHDAQMFAPNCPTAMVFVPSKGGISHNIEEYTAPEELQAGANVLLQAALTKAEEK
ncbi:N-carbamoyl-L-amino-acid hydrolase [Cohaesibacter marisflavi]|uniref:N-carbamoyl-L-amino-acid hydrolase n=1 Tax=Cohaesibacter marisflavi TaxID=655353 RepID=A0A1I5LAZ9_9HYPH|nr:M20 family metallo-hydrolase [Cohaesibacter marisflavi]SFO94036.1 N-carbamoyl-L-amino-acid hydrolase [Cohaesibacter marisflavi]